MLDPAPDRRRPPTLVGYLTAGATPVWLLGSFAVLSLLYRTPAPAGPGDDTEDQELAAGEGASKRERARAAYAALIAAGQPVTGAPLAEAASVSASYGRALLAEFQVDPTLASQANGQRPGPEVGSGDRDHLADLPQLRQLLRAAPRPRPQAGLLLPGCQQAAYRARQRTSVGQHHSRQDRRQDWRSERH